MTKTYKRDLQNRSNDCRDIWQETDKRPVNETNILQKRPVKETYKRDL